jgi:hypothetical protein
MSRTYKFPERPLIYVAHVGTNFIRAEAVQRALTAANVPFIDVRSRNELWSLVSERGCPPAKAVAIVTGAALPRAERPRAVA